MALNLFSNFLFKRYYDASHRLAVKGIDVVGHFFDTLGYQAIYGEDDSPHYTASATLDDHLNEYRETVDSKTFADESGIATRRFKDQVTKFKRQIPHEKSSFDAIGPLEMKHAEELEALPITALKLPDPVVLPVILPVNLPDPVAVEYVAPPVTLPITLPDPLAANEVVEPVTTEPSQKSMMSTIFDSVGDVVHGLTVGVAKTLLGGAILGTDAVVGSKVAKGVVNTGVDIVTSGLENDITENNNIQTDKRTDHMGDNDLRRGVTPETSPLVKREPRQPHIVFFHNNMAGYAAKYPNDSPAQTVARVKKALILKLRKEKDIPPEEIKDYVKTIGEHQLTYGQQIQTGLLQKIGIFGRIPGEVKVDTVDPHSNDYIPPDQLQYGPEGDIIDEFGSANPESKEEIMRGRQQTIDKNEAVSERQKRQNDNANNQFKTPRFFDFPNNLNEHQSAPEPDFTLGSEGGNSYAEKLYDYVYPENPIADPSYAGYIPPFDNSAKRLKLTAPVDPYQALLGGVSQGALNVAGYTMMNYFKDSLGASTFGILGKLGIPIIQKQLSNYLFDPKHNLSDFAAGVRVADNMNAEILAGASTILTLQKATAGLDSTVLENTPQDVVNIFSQAVSAVPRDQLDAMQSAAKEFYRFEISPFAVRPAARRY